MAGALRELPARLPEEVAAELRSAASAVVNEVNTIPGSLARYLWVDPPVPFSVLLADLLDEAVHRPTHAYSATGADGSVLRSAGSIAGKLA